MKLLVVSDNHGDRDILEKVFATADSETTIFHCGDSELAADDEIWSDVSVVKGNMDWDEYPEMLTNQVGDQFVFLTHGHLFDVNDSLNKLSLKAEELGANMVLFGHTHQLGAEVRDHTLFLNPGSISQPRGKYADLGGTYAVIEETPATFDVTYFNRDAQVIDDLSMSLAK
ncbi:metallophosphoesterase [Levilactobacillus bambusae]|uniref:Phosphoesterase n=1 Tax=Levilactobacillus bambusae TaxID=2024736 RepID=A0A2V1MZP5_9LACO|nr:metallophosphoesterase [Levilactobacillus bambusae]PWF99595.1 YfcE family phosphodiesterase [Levilactobacillus bambusae]